MKARWRLIGDGEIRGYYRSGEDVLAAADASPYRLWAQQRKIGRRWYTQGFGYSGDVPLSDLAAMGVPINAKALADDV